MHYRARLCSKIVYFLPFIHQILHNDHMQWDDIRAFIAVAEVGTLSGAARELGVTHATVARRIADLEGDVGGTPLFERSRSGYVLTSSGRAALAHAKAMSAAAEGFAREVNDADVMAGAVRISATAAVADWKIAPVAASLAKAHPRLEIHLVTENRNISLALREADIAVRLGRPAAGEALARKIGVIRYRLFGTSEYIHSTNPEGRQVFTFSDTIRRETIPLAIASVLDGYRSQLALPSFSSQASAALIGTGVAMLPDFMQRQFAGLIPVDDSEACWDQEVWLLTHTDARRFHRVQAVANAIAAAFEP